MKTLTKIEYVDEFPIYDISVADDNCFELENGVIAHNSMYPKDIVAGGCLIPGTKIIMADGSLKNIEDIKENEYVKTLLGDREVTHTWNPDTLIEGEPECYEIEFEDGHKVICSENHMFMPQTDSSTDFFSRKWIKAKDITVGCDVVLAQ